MKKSLDKMVEYTVVFDGKPLYSLLESDGFHSRVVGVIEDILARFGRSAYERIAVLRHILEPVSTDTFVSCPGTDSPDVE